METPQEKPRSTPASRLADTLRRRVSDKLTPGQPPYVPGPGEGEGSGRLRGAAARAGGYLAGASRRAWQGDILHYSASIAAVQGGTLLTQFLVARVLGPNRFGSVRVVEAAIVLLATIGNLGLPTAIMRYPAIEPDEHRRGQLLVRFAATALVSGAIVATLIAVGVPHTRYSYLGSLRWVLASVVALAIVDRTLINYFMGVKRVRTVARINLLWSLGAVALVVTGTEMFGLRGWTITRIAAEAVLAIAVILLAAPSARRPAKFLISGPILTFGLMSAMGLVLDKIATTADTLYLSYYMRDSAAVGQYGIATILVTVGGLVPAAASQAALPRVAERYGTPSVAIRYLFSVLVPVAIFAAVVGAGIALFGRPLLVHLVGTSYAVAGSLLPVLAPTLLFNSMGSMLSAYLMGMDRAGASLGNTAVGVLTNVALNAVLIPRYQIWGVATAALLTSFVRCAGASALVAWPLRRRHESR